MTLWEDPISESLEAEELLEQLYQALAKLTERQRDLIILRYYTGKTLKEISVSLGMSYINTKITHKKALGSLQKLLSAQ